MNNCSTTFFSHCKVTCSLKGLVGDYGGRAAKVLSTVFPTLSSLTLIPGPVSVGTGRHSLERALAG